jgi:hypothetical protein
VNSPAVSPDESLGVGSFDTGLLHLLGLLARLDLFIIVSPEEFKESPVDEGCDDDA